MIGADLVWIVPCVVIIASLLIASLWARSANGRTATGEKLLKHNRAEEAEACFRQATGKLSGTAGERSPLMVRACLGLAECLRRRGSMTYYHLREKPVIQEGVAVLQTALDVGAALPGFKNQQAHTHAQIGHLLVLLSDNEGAVPHLAVAADHFDKEKPLKDSKEELDLRTVLGELGCSLYELKRYGEAQTRLARYLELQPEECRCDDMLWSGGKTAPSICYAWTLVELGKLKEADTLFGEFIEQTEKLEADIIAEDPTTIDRLSQVEVLQVLRGRVLLLLNKREAAKALFCAAIDRRKADGVFGEEYAEIVDAALDNYKVGDQEPALLMARVIKDKEVLSQDDVRLLPDLQRLGLALAAQKKAGQAEAAFRRACDLERQYRPNVVPTSQPLLVTALLMQNKVKEARTLSGGESGDEK